MLDGRALAKLDISAIANRLASCASSSSALTRSYLERIGQLDPDLNAYTSVLWDESLEAAAASDQRARQHQRIGPLDGIPIAIKDNIDVRGIAATAGTKARRNRVPAADAEVVRRLREAGAVILGKTGMHEAAMGGTNDNPFFGRVHHPMRHGYTPGGSSGGSAVAVAAEMCAAALGTDTLGSVRIPAAYCGIVGLKPTHGLISTRGVTPLCYRLDDVGLMARSVADVAALLESAKGFDPDCPDSRPEPGNTDNVAASGLTGIAVGLVRNFDAIPLDADVSRAFAAALALLERLGARLEDVSLSGYEPAVARRAGLLCGEADAANTYEEIIANRPEELSDEVRALMIYGRDVKGGRLAKATRYLDLVAFEMRKAFRAVQFIVSPTTPQPAFPFDAPAPATQGDMTALANIAGCPALTISMGSSETGLPLGLQLMAPPYQEARLLALGKLLTEEAGLGSS